MPTVRLALFVPANGIHGPVALQEKHDDNGRTDLVRCSEWKDVEFAPLNADSKTAELHRLDVQRMEAARRYEAELLKLDKRARALSGDKPAVHSAQSDRLS